MPTYADLAEAAATILVVVAAHLRQGMHTSRRTARLERQVRKLRTELADCLAAQPKKGDTR